MEFQSKRPRRQGRSQRDPNREPSAANSSNIQVCWSRWTPPMANDFKSLIETALVAENAGLRELLAQAGIDAARLLAQAGIDATENETAKRLQRLLLEE